MSRTPLVSINIPTYNSQQTIGKTLDAVVDQTYESKEVIVVDNGSSDDTIRITKEYDVRVFQNRKALLESRCIGISASKGDFILMLDSDQILAPNSIDRAVSMMDSPSIDYLFLVESAVKSESLLEKLYSADRKVVQTYECLQSVDSLRFNSLPRFFRSDLIKNAILSIPLEIRESVIYRDHAVIFAEVGRLSSNGGWLDTAIFHNENNSIKSLIRKHFRYGVDDYILSHSIYNSLLRNKWGARMTFSRDAGVSMNLLSFTLSLIKLLPYVGGYLLSSLKGSVGSSDSMQNLV